MLFDHQRHRYVQPVESALAVMLAVLALLAVSACSPRVDVAPPFEAISIALETYGLFDLGIVDADHDGRLDLFTSTHSGPQSLALNRGDMRFEDVFSAWGLDQHAEFPGLAVLPTERSDDAAGLYVNWRGAELVVRAVGLGTDPNAITGTIELYSAVAIGEQERYQVSVKRTELAPRVAHSIVRFAGSGDGHFAIRPSQHSVPITLNVNSGATAEQIRVGPRRVPPVSTGFTLLMRDRHGMAWADYDGDGATDLFVTRGGIQGTMKYLPLRFFDELFVSRRHRMRDVGPAAALDKQGCPGREAAWVDYDRDGRLDLYVVCGRDGGGEDFSNQLFRQKSDGTFVDIAHQVGLALSGEGKFSWGDDDDDGDVDMLWVDRTGIIRFENVDDRFAPQSILRFARPVQANGLRTGDVNGDGRDDFYVSAPTGAVLLLRQAAGFAAVEPESLGLPASGLAAGFVDIDNDGVEEFFSVPQGLYRRGRDGKYSSTGELAWRAQNLSYQRLTDAHAAWADFDGDGSRDLLLAANLATKRGNAIASRIAWLFGDDSPTVGPLRGRWTTQILRNELSGNHWLQVDLIGPPGNRSAIGAKVQLESDRGHLEHALGHAEGSVYSQGHYRLYFGLGENHDPDRLVVIWPDGTRQTVEHPGCDQRVTIAWSHGVTK